MKHPNTTLEGIAAKLNLSPSLVSRVLNNKPSARAAEQTRRRIFEMARELNYRPNLSARNLTKGKSYSVAFVCDLSTGFSVDAAAFELCAEMLAEQGYELKLKPFRDHSSVLNTVSEMIAAGSIDGLVLWSTEHEMDDVGTLAENMHIPFVIKGRFEVSHPQWLQVDFDHEAMSGDAVRYLVERGYRQLGLVTYDNDLSYNVKHIDGYRAAIVQHGLDLRSVDRHFRQSHSPSDYNDIHHFLNQQIVTADGPPLEALVVTSISAIRPLELALMDLGFGIGFGRGQIALVGMISSENPLLAGQAVTFESFDVAALSERLIRSLLMPQLKGEAIGERIVRYRPKLTAIRGLTEDHLKVFGKFAAAHLS